MGTTLHGDCGGVLTAGMSNRSQQIADLLTKAILAQRLAPGTKLGERELSEIFSVSRIVVRQALIRLADGGLVTIERHRGAFVARPSLQEALEIYDTLTLIEQGIAAQLAERLGPSGWAELRQHVGRQRQAVEAGNDALADQLGQDFHGLLVRLVQNRIAFDIHAQLTRRAMLLRSLCGSRFDYCSLLEEHQRIVDLLEKGKVRPACDLIDTHYRHVVRGYLLEEVERERLTPRDALAPYLLNGTVAHSVGETDAPDTTAPVVRFPGGRAKSRRKA
jgi:DNA-binding GntR family transcriptional regulator